MSDVLVNVLQRKAGNYASFRIRIHKKSLNPPPFLWNYAENKALLSNYLPPSGGWHWGGGILYIPMIKHFEKILKH